MTQIEDRAFRRVTQKADRLAAHVVKQCDEIMASMPDIVAYQTMVDLLATGIMERDEQLFKWLLESWAAKKVWEKDAAEANLHPEHPTAH
jgi:hypothetical protein